MNAMKMIIGAATLALVACGGTPKSGLKKGSYKASWTIVASDGDNQHGSFTFKLK